MVNIMGIEPTRREGKDLAFDSTEVSHSTLYTPIQTTHPHIRP